VTVIISIILLRNYREGNETDDMQHIAALSDVNSSVAFTKLIYLKNIDMKPMSFSQITKALGFSYSVTISRTTRNFNCYIKLIHGLLNDAVSN